MRRDSIIKNNNFRRAVTANALRVAEIKPELNYIAGMAMCDLSLFSGLSESSRNIIAVGWNYSDGICALFKGVAQLKDTDNYRRDSTTVRAIINILNGVQLLALSNTFGLFNYGTGILAGATPLAASSFAFAMLCDLVDLAIQLYEVSQELNLKGWFIERNKELAFLNIKCAEEKDLNKSDELNKRRMLLQGDIACRERCHPDAEKPNTSAPEDKKKDKEIEDEIKKRFQEIQRNLIAKTFSFIGMTLAAVASFVSSPNLVLAATIICTAVAAYYCAKYVAKSYPILFKPKEAEDTTQAKTLDPPPILAV